MAKKKYNYKRASFVGTLPDGTQKQFIFTGKTQREANMKRDKAKAEYDAGLLTVNNKTTVSRWFEEWMEIYKIPNVQDSTAKEIRGYFERSFLPLIGAVRLCDLRPLHIQKCLNDLKGMSESYIKKHYVYIQECLKAAPDGSFRYDPLKNLSLPAGKGKKTHRALTPEERELFLAAIREHRRGSFFGFIYACGARPAEARALKIFDVDLEARRVSIRSAVESRTTRREKTPKTKAGSRTVIIPGWYLPMITEAVKKAAAAGSAYVWPNTNGQIMCPNIMYRSWSSLCREMDILAGAELYRNKIIVHAIAQDLEPYDLRHDFCTRLCENGVDLKTAQYLMGHSSIGITADIYTHVTEHLLSDAEAKINGENKKTIKKSENASITP
ncbi:MAG: tyrosine-type recombinase/integrase [Bacillota bacterium]|jgi:integrase